MKSCFRLFGAFIVGLVLSAFIMNGGQSLNLSKAAQAQLTDVQFTDIITNIDSLPSNAQEILGNLSPEVFSDLSTLSPAELSNLISLDSGNLTGFPGITNNTITALANLPDTAVDSLLSGLNPSSILDLGNATDTIFGQLDTFLELGDALSLDSLDIINQFDSIIPGNLNDILNIDDFFSNFDIANLDNIASGLGVDFGDFTSNITDALNVNIDEFINLDFAELSGLGIDNLGDLLGDLGLPNSVLNGLASDLGTTVGNLLNADLGNLDLLGISGLDDLSDIIGINPEDFLDDLVTNLGINPEDLLSDLTGFVDIDINELLDLDLDVLSGLGLDNLDDLATLIGGDINTLLGDLSTALNIPITDLANLDLDALTDALDLSSIGDIADIIGLDPGSLLNDISTNLGIDIGDFTDIGLDVLSDIGLDNALDVANALGLDPADLAASLGIGVDDLINTSIPDIGAALGVDSLSGIATAIGLDPAGAINAIAGAIGAALGLGGGGGLTITFTATTSAGSCNSVPYLGCCSNPECVCSGWCIPTPSCSCCGCTVGEACDFCTGTCDYIDDAFDNELMPFWDIELDQYERWLVQDYLAGYVLPSMMAMAEELTNVAMLQVVAIGSFFDAKMELQTHRLLQDFHTQAHKDYHPSEGVCVFATNVRALAMTDRMVDLNQSALSTRAINRHLGIENDNGASDTKSDLGERFIDIAGTEYTSGRLKQFQDEFCNPKENDENMRFLCGNSGAGATDDDRFNRDIDYYENFASQKTLYINLLRTEATTTDEQRKRFEDFLAMSKNLYGHKVPFRPPTSSFDYDAATSYFRTQEYQDNNPLANYLNMRSMLAKRSVAENSFHAQAALKSGGNASSNGYLYSILQELGMNSDAIAEMLKGGASYYAQMEILTKKIYQNPQFYIDLYDKPANVKRKHVALKGIGLMQDWDTFEVKLRTEMLASILLELHLIEAQKAIENK